MSKGETAESDEGETDGFGSSHGTVYHLLPLGWGGTCYLAKIYDSLTQHQIKALC